MNNHFSENLKRIRKEHNLSQEQLADELGVSRQAISKWESAVAYPEMDKIISLCDKFNLNIDDLLHKDIKEVKKEEESKRKINNYINEFLNFITDTVNLFSNMRLKNKIKCVFEQLMIIAFLLITSYIISNVFNTLTFSLFSFFPNDVRYFISNTLVILFTIVCITFSVVTTIHIFKIRYLNYYNNIKETLNNKNNTNEKIKLEEDKKIDLKMKENKIIIRDPKHSEYKFINGLFKLIIGIIKFFLLCFALFLAFILICLLGSFVMAFLIYKTGLFFIGIIITILSSTVITITIMLLILNFIFNRKSEKKKTIWSFILSLIVFGIGCGLISIGTLNFEILEDNENMLKTVTTEHKMKENLILYPDYDLKIDYVESDIINLKIEYWVNDLCDIEEHINDDKIIVWSYCKNPTRIVKRFINNINQKKIIPINNNIEKITVYANKSNIEKLKSNCDNYIENRNHYDNTISSYEKK